MTGDCHVLFLYRLGLPESEPETELEIEIDRLFLIYGGDTAPIVEEIADTRFDVQSYVRSEMDFSPYGCIQGPLQRPYHNVFP